MLYKLDKESDFTRQVSEISGQLAVLKIPFDINFRMQEC